MKISVPLTSNSRTVVEQFHSTLPSLIQNDMTFSMHALL